MNWKFWKKPDDYDKLNEIIDDLTKRVDKFHSGLTPSDPIKFRYKKDGITKEYF